MAAQVPDEVKQQRIEGMIEVVQKLAARRNLERVGRVEEVLVEGPSRTDPTTLRGRTRRNTTVNFVGDASAGDLVGVRIEGATSTTLRGTAVGPRRSLTHSRLSPRTTRAPFRNRLGLEGGPRRPQRDATF